MEFFKVEVTNCRIRYNLQEVSEVVLGGGIGNEQSVGLRLAHSFPLGINGESVICSKSEHLNRNLNFNLK